MSKDNLKEVTEVPVIEAASSQPTASEPTVQQLAFMLHLSKANDVRTKIAAEADELKARQAKIKYLHEIMQEVNNALDKQGNLDLTKNPELQKKLKAATEMGVKIPEDLSKFDVHQSKRLMDNLTYVVEDFEKEDSTQMRKITSLYTESEQSIMIAKNTLSAIDKPLRAAIAGIKGS